MKIEKWETYVQSAWQQKLHHTPESPETASELWFETRRSKQGNWVQSGNMAEAIHRYEHKTKNKSQEWFWEGLLQTD